MAHQIESMDGLDIRIIHATVRGWILAHTLATPLTVARIAFELGLSERQAGLGLAEAQATGLVQGIGNGQWNRTSMPPRA